MLCYNKLADFNVLPINENGEILVPICELAENLGATVEWDEAAQTITICKNEKTVILTIGSSVASVDGESVAIDTPAKVTGGSPMVSLKFVAEEFGAEFFWDEALNMAIVR